MTVFPNWTTVGHTAATRDDATFAQWMGLVDSYLVKWVGLHHDDFADRLWKDAYNDEMTPLEAIDNFWGTTTDVEIFFANERDY